MNLSVSIPDRDFSWLKVIADGLHRQGTTFQSLIGILADWKQATDYVAWGGAVSIPDRDFSWLKVKTSMKRVNISKFQSLIGILADWKRNIVFSEAKDARFQSLIGILADWKGVFCVLRTLRFVSIPDRDFSWLKVLDFLC